MIDPLRFLGEGKVEIPPARMLAKPNPSKPKYVKSGCSNEIQRFWREQTQASYLPCNLSVTAETGPFFRKYECARPIKDSVLSGDHPNKTGMSFRFRRLGLATARSIKDSEATTVAFRLGKTSGSGPKPRCAIESTR